MAIVFKYDSMYACKCGKHSHTMIEALKCCRQKFALERDINKNAPIENIIDY